MQILSPRLTLREFREEDFPLFMLVFSSELIMRYALMDAYRSSDDARPYFESILRNNTMFDHREAYQFGVFLTDGPFIGFADIEIPYRNESGGYGEIGYFLLPEFWGRGFATEISHALIEFGFAHLRLHRLVAHCNANNTPSERVMQKSGLIKEGESRKARFKHGQWDSELQYAILLEDWKNPSCIEVTS